MSQQQFSTGAFLKKLRGERSQEEMAKQLDISRKTVIRYEAGEAVPDAEVLLKLNVIYGVDPLHVLTGRRPDAALVGTEKELLQNYRLADDADKKIIEGTAGLAAQLKAARAGRK